MDAIAKAFGLNKTVTMKDIVKPSVSGSAQKAVLRALKNAQRDQANLIKQAQNIQAKSK
jgi:hypothetical protein